MLLQLRRAAVPGTSSGLVLRREARGVARLTVLTMRARWSPGCVDVRRYDGVQLRLHNTLGATMQQFTSLESGIVRMYSCGPTVYACQHIRNLRVYVCADTLRRVLEGIPGRLRHNITDVGHLVSDVDAGTDKLELASAREHRSVRDRGPLR